MKTILYATDLSVCSQNAGFYAAFLARHFSAELIVAHAFTLSQAATEVEIDPFLISEQRKDLEFLLSRKAGKLHGRALLVEGDPKRVLVELADQHAPTLLVLGTHGGGWIEREILGSVAEKVIRSTSWPVVTVGPQVKSAAGKHLRFQRILYATGSAPAEPGAAADAECFAQSFAAEIDVLQVVEGGHANRRILRHIQDRAIDLLVLGVNRASHFSIRNRNSGAFRLILHAPCPVLTVAGALGC